MKIELEFNNLSGSPVSRSFLAEVAADTFRRCGLDFGRKKIGVSVAAVTAREIKRLNRTYRAKDEVTDILSFAEYPDFLGRKSLGDNDLFLGEIILCYNYMADFAKKNQRPIRTELARVMSHGLLHLLGFRHGKKMFALQDEVADRFKNKK